MPSLAEIYPDLGQLSFPRPEGETVTLPDGRTLGYSVHVVRPSTTNDKPCTETCSINAAGDDSQLPAIILFPGTPGSRFFRHPALDDQSPHGSRMYILERPGIGLSSACRFMTYQTFAHDFRAFCQALGLHANVRIVAYSAGTPFALACTCSCPDIVSHVALVSTIAPPNAPNLHVGQSLLFRFGYFACRHMQCLVRWMVASEASGMRRDPLRALRQSWGGYTSAADKQALARPAVEKAFLHSALELYSRAQESTILQENFLFTHDWGFQLKDIPASVRVRVWQGAEDSGCTPGMAEYVAGQVAGCEDCQVVAGEGHMVFFNDQVWRHVLDWACG